MRVIQHTHIHTDFIGLFICEGVLRVRGILHRRDFARWRIWKMPRDMMDILCVLQRACCHSREEWIVKDRVTTWTGCRSCGCTWGLLLRQTECHTCIIPLDVEQQAWRRSAVFPILSCHERRQVWDQSPLLGSDWGFWRVCSTRPKDVGLVLLLVFFRQKDKPTCILSLTRMSEWWDSSCWWIRSS